jgi:hypothetical protein
MRPQFLDLTNSLEDDEDTRAEYKQAMMTTKLAGE